jgi:hypothetical protein
MEKVGMFYGHLEYDGDENVSANTPTKNWYHGQGSNSPGSNSQGSNSQGSNFITSTRDRTNRDRTI